MNGIEEILIQQVGPSVAVALSAAWAFYKKLETRVDAQICDLRKKLDECERDRVITAHKLGKLEGRIELQESRTLN